MVAESLLLFSMSDLLVDIEQLATGNLQRLVLTAIVVAIVVGVRIGAGMWRSRTDDQSSRQRILVSTTIAATTAAGILAILAVWGLGEALVAAFDAAAIRDHLSNIILAVILLAGAYALTDFIGGVIREISKESTAINEHQEEILRRMTQIGIYAVVVLVVIGLFTDNVGGLLVGAGFLGIVVGMAARQTLGAALAGFVLMFSRPFEVGDWVQIGDHEGTVTEISIINTRLRSFNGEYVTLPNDDVRAKPVIDRSRRNRLRIEVDVAIDYETDVNRAASVALESIEDIDDIAMMPEPNAVCKRFADSGVVLGVRYWIRDPSMRKRWRTQTAVMSAIKAGFDYEGITIPFPQQTLSARGEDLDVRIGEPIDPRTSDTGSDGSGGTSTGGSEGMSAGGSGGNSR